MDVCVGVCESVCVDIGDPKPQSSISYRITMSDCIPLKLDVSTGSRINYNH